MSSRLFDDVLGNPSSPHSLNKIFGGLFPDGTFHLAALGVVPITIFTSIQGLGSCATKNAQNKQNKKRDRRGTFFTRMRMFNWFCQKDDQWRVRQRSVCWTIIVGCSQRKRKNVKSNMLRKVCFTYTPPVRSVRTTISDV